MLLHNLIYAVRFIKRHSGFSAINILIWVYTDTTHR
jgi:hypothetical protein